MTSPGRLLLGIDDLSDDDVRNVLVRAEDHERTHRPPPGAPFTIGLVFLTSSLRTRVGFGVAAHRLGGSAIDVVEHRMSSGMSSGESLADTIRAVSGMVDIVVVRTPTRLDRDEMGRNAVVPLVSGGDGPGEHPTQALIDLRAIERERGPIGDVTVGLCGDMSARSAVSFLRLLGRLPPRRLVLIAPPSRSVPPEGLAPVLAARTTWREVLDLEGLDVLSMVGLPEGEGDDRLDDSRRASFALGREHLGGLDGDAVVLSPMPVIDEVAPDARDDPRVRMFPQSDAAVATRMAVLELLLERL